MSIDKQLHGDLEANNKGEMLTAMTDVKGSAGYVAIERISGKLNGRSGNFVMQHSGTMSLGWPGRRRSKLSMANTSTTSNTPSPKRLN
jgi:hypothetical protein